MSILSNYVPSCLARAEVSCPVADLSGPDSVEPEEMARKILQAVNIAKVEPYRAVTHNKGIMNGIDAVVLATGNDFRAVEAGVHMPTQHVTDLIKALRMPVWKTVCLNSGWKYPWRWERLAVLRDYIRWSILRLQSFSNPRPEN